MTCSSTVGLDKPWPDGPTMFAYMNEAYLKLAIETKTDMIFLSERFCGHGFHHENPKSPCYLGPGAESWFDLTCIHPNPTGHSEIARMFMNVVNES